MSSNRPTSNSTILVDEAFATQDDAFVERLRSISSLKYLSAFADRWKKDPRTWARDQIFQYLAQPLDRAGHHSLVKRLFKHAEAGNDDELMAAFLVAFDRLIRRVMQTHQRWDMASRQIYSVQLLLSPRDQILATDNNNLRRKGHGKLFSYRTRRYLQRRAWRYFRRMGFQRPNDYPRAIAKALKIYRDADVEKGENILDNWSLMHAGFFRSPVLQFRRTSVVVAVDQSMANLTAAPQFERLWSEQRSTSLLLRLVLHAESRLVRVWSMQVLKQHHLKILESITADQLLQLLDSSDADVQQFGASLLGSLNSTDRWEVSTWLRLLETRSIAALGTICEVMQQKVQPERLTLEQCIALANNRMTPIARLGFSWLSAREITSPADRTILTQVSEARCEAVGGEIAQFALSILGSAEFYRLEQVIAFFDSLNPKIRRGSWEWLKPSCVGYRDPELWSRLSETPYEDVRIQLVAELGRRATNSAKAPVVNAENLERVWTSVLYSVHRGGRAKLLALRQISNAIALQPERGAQLVPVLAVAIRSVRRSESRAGLSAILRAVAGHPGLEALLAKHIPELKLSPEILPATEGTRKE